jgi:hypothetical protein
VYATVLVVAYRYLHKLTLINYILFMCCVVLCIEICCSVYLNGVVLCIVFVDFVVLCNFFVCKCVLYYCHRVSTQLRLNISYICSVYC